MYKLTEYLHGVYNAGGVGTVTVFESFTELQDHILETQAGMAPEEVEVYQYNISIEEV